jgi:uncharacterized iron-regulated protein
MCSTYYVPVISWVAAEGSCIAAQNVSTEQCELDNVSCEAQQIVLHRNSPIKQLFKFILLESVSGHPCDI